MSPSLNQSTESATTQGFTPAQESATPTEPTEQTPAPQNPAAPATNADSDSAINSAPADSAAPSTPADSVTTAPATDTASQAPQNPATNPASDSAKHPAHSHLLASTPPELAPITAELISQLTSLYPALTIEQIAITPTNPLPADFADYKLQELFLLSLQNSAGNARAQFWRPDSTATKSLFFTFKIDAYATVLVTNKDLERGHQLTQADFTPQKTSLKNFNKSSLTIADATKIALVAKSKIRRGRVLLNSHFAAATDIKKGDTITAILNEGALSLTTQATALGAGSVGETISIQLENGQTTKAMVIAPAQVRIQ